MNRVTKRTIKNLSNVVLSEESFSYDAAGNITSAPTGSFAYDTDNRLTAFNGNTVSYDMDGNLLSNGAMTCTYDSANRLLTSGGHTYTYNAEGVRIRNLCAGEDAAYTYNTNSKLSQLLMKTVGTAVTKYVYGLGLIGEETDGDFKTYHFDSRGSTIAITDEDGNITDTFAYDTYGKMTSRTGTTPVIFGYNGLYGVVTDANGLLYMRARYYSPAMRRFVNADVIPGNISKAVTLNRYAFADANPVLKVDPLGLMACPFGICPACVGQEDYNNYLAGIVKEEELIQKYHLDTKTPSVPATRPPKHTMDDDTEPETVNKDKYKEYTTEKNNKVSNEKKEDKFDDFIFEIECWFEDVQDFLNRYALNEDGTYSLHDNRRSNKDTVFHEQIFVFNPSGPSFDLKKGNVGLGSIEFDMLTGGWEYEHVDLSLLDTGHVEVGAEIKDGNIKIGALASAFSPSISFTIGKVSITLGVEAFAIGAGFKKVENGISLSGAFLFGGSISFSILD